MWQRIRADCGRGGAPSVRWLFGDERNVPAILEFLEETRVGKMPGRVLLAGGPDLEEGELGGFSLQFQGEEEGTEVSSSEEEDGPSPPPRLYFSFIFPLSGGLERRFAFLLLGGSWEGD